MTKGPMVVRYRLPVSYSTEIGRFISRWAHLEWIMQETAYTMLKMSPKIGRIALREPRVNDYLTMLEDLTKICGITISWDWQKLRNAARPMEKFRNQLAHGVWLHDPNSKYPTLRQARGRYPSRPGAKTENAKINPASMPVPLRELKNAIAGVDRFNSIILEIKSEIAAQLEP